MALLCEADLRREHFSNKVGVTNDVEDFLKMNSAICNLSETERYGKVYKK